MIFCVDIDNTLCITKGNDYIHSIPIQTRITTINRLFDKGHYIKIFTGRGSHSGKDWRDFTEKQLKQWNVKYHELIMGKPHADIFFDDKAVDIDYYSNAIPY